MLSIPEKIAAELSVQPRQVEAAVGLLDEGATVPFIARYRKEATGGLDDGKVRTLEERLRYLRELEEGRAVVLKSIADQGKLTPELAAKELPALKRFAPRRGLDRAAPRFFPDQQSRSLARVFPAALPLTRSRL